LLYHLCRKGRGIVTNQEVEEITGHFDKVAQEIRVEFRGEITGVRQDARAQVAAVRDHTDVVAKNLRQEIAEVRRHASFRLDALTSEMRIRLADVRAEIHRLHESDDELRRRIEAQEQRGA